MSIPVISFIGQKRCGKTTVIEKVVAELKRRGYRVATIKRHSHTGFDIDIPGKDTWRFARSGSDQVIIASPDKLASYRLLQHELELDDVLKEVKDVDIVLTEGYSKAGMPSIEVVREAHYRQLIAEPTQRIALASDTPLGLDVPQFSRADAAGLVDFILGWIAENTAPTET